MPRAARAVLGFVSRQSFVLSLLATVALASLLPARGGFAVLADHATSVAIGLLFFLYGTRLSPRDAWDGLRHWRLHLTVVVATFVVFPLLGLAGHLLAPTILTPELAIGLAFLCCLPSTVQSSIAFTSTGLGSGATVSPQWAISQPSSVGSCTFRDISFAAPYKSAAPGTNVTVSSPAAQTHTAFTIKVYYYFAP